MISGLVTLVQELLRTDSDLAERLVGKLGDLQATLEQVFVISDNVLDHILEDLALVLGRVRRTYLEERSAEQHRQLDLGILVVTLALVDIVVRVVPPIVDVDKATARPDVDTEHRLAVKLVVDRDVLESR